MRFFQDANYRFIDYRYLGYAFSGSLILISIITLFVRGIQYGIDFRGGTELIITCVGEPDVVGIRGILTSAFGKETGVRQYGVGGELQVRTDVAFADRGVAEVAGQALAGSPCTVGSSNQIGPVFAKDIREAAFNATIFSIIVIGFYIFIRFKESAFMISVIATLVHDTIIIIGLFTLLNGILPFDMDVDQNLVAALLTIIGYSMNDTIVVFDRIRENRNIHKGMALPQLINMSINQTLCRTVVTSLTTFFVVVVLFFFGGDTLKSFSFALMLGILLGTYSTVFFSCPMILDLPARKVTHVREHTRVKAA